MRNREQIYGQEAAGLLRNITVYHCIRHDQLLRLYPGQEDVIENLLRYLVRQQRIFYNADRDCYGDVPDCREDRELTAALWVLLDFIEKVEYHSPDDMPVKLVFFAEGEVYEVIYVSPDKEAMRQHALSTEDESGRRLVIIEEEAQMQRLRNMNCELNERGLLLPREMLAECQLADISLNAHLCRSALVLLPEQMSARELVGAWESLRKVNGALFDALLAACRSDCDECRGDHTVEGVSELLLTLLIDNGGCPASLADHICQEDVVYRLLPEYALAGRSSALLRPAGG